MTQLRRTIAIATALTAGVTSLAVAQRPRSGSGGVATTPSTVSQPPRPSAGSGRGTIGTSSRGPSAAVPRSGGVPRIITAPARRSDPRPTFGGTFRGDGSGRAYGTGSMDNRPAIAGGVFSGGSHPRAVTRYRRPPYSRWGASVGCAYGCFRIGIGRTASFVGSFHFGYPFGIPIYVPYIVETTTYVHHDEPTYDSQSAYDMRAEAAPSPGPAASKLIVVGGGTGAGDAVTVETIGDSVRLSWLAAGRAAREVRLFVADSAKRELAARTASPSAPVATFEVVTLSAPVAFAGVAVTFTDGVTTTTVVPYQHGQRR